MNHRMRFLGWLLGATTAALASGCASIVNGQNQSLSVATMSDGGDVAGAKCMLSNNKGIWYATTPASVTVHRSYQDLSIVCSLDGYDRGTLTVKSATKAMAFGNILFGGVIGAGVDIGTGAAYDYPALIKVQLTQTAKADGEKKPADPAGPTAASEPAQAPAKPKL